MYRNNTISQDQSNVNELTKVFYDRRNKVYVVRNGQELGRYANKKTAQWRAIAHDTPQAGGLAGQMLVKGYDEGRLMRACRLIAEKKVFRFKRDGEFIEALIQGSEDSISPVTGLNFYHVFHNLIWTCTCEDYERHGSGHRCKHTMAVEIISQVLTEKSERSSGHYNANLTPEEHEAKLAEAQADQERAQKWLERHDQAPRYNGFGGPVSEQRQQVRASLGGALKPDPINRHLPNRDFNIRRK